MSLKNDQKIPKKKRKENENKTQPKISVISYEITNIVIIV